MNATLPVTIPPATPDLSLDELVARGLSASELAVATAYATWTKTSLLVWVAKIRRTS